MRWCDRRNRATSTDPTGTGEIAELRRTGRQPASQKFVALLNIRSLEVQLS